MGMATSWSYDQEQLNKLRMKFGFDWLSKTDERRRPASSISPLMSLRLRWANNSSNVFTVAYENCHSF